MLRYKLRTLLLLLAILPPVLAGVWLFIWQNPRFAAALLLVAIVGTVTGAAIAELRRIWST